MISTKRLAIINTPLNGAIQLSQALAATKLFVDRGDLYVGYGEGVTEAAVNAFFNPPGSTADDGQIDVIRVNWDYLDRLADLSVMPPSAVLEKFSHLVFVSADEPLTQSIAWMIAQRTGVYTPADLLVPGKGNTSNVPYNERGIALNIQAVHQANARWETYFEETAIDPLRFSTEDLQKEDGLLRAVKAILKFVGEKVPAKLALEPIEWLPDNPLIERYTDDYLTNAN